jgi:hypothetical protein
MNQMTNNTGIGESKISVRLKNGKAKNSKQGCPNARECLALTIIAQKCDDEVVGQRRKIHRIAEEVGNGEVWGDEW